MPAWFFFPMGLRGNFPHGSGSFYFYFYISNRPDSYTDEITILLADNDGEFGDE
jgi:hypothetical protein